MTDDAPMTTSDKPIKPKTKPRGKNLFNDAFIDNPPENSY
jgi:hypothetical protein